MIYAADMHGRGHLGTTVYNKCECGVSTINMPTYMVVHAGAFIF
jgi:hypothetical protein